MSFQTFSVHAKVKEPVMEKETSEVDTKKLNFFEDLHYRIIYKDTKDFFDWVLLGTAVVALLIVIVFQNTHYVIITRPLEENFLDLKRNYTIEEVIEKQEIVEETPDTIEAEQTEEIETNSEILSSDFLEEEKEEVPRKKKNKNSKKKRA